MRYRCGMGREDYGSEYLINISATWEREEQLSKFYNQAIFEYNRSLQTPGQENNMDLEVRGALDSGSNKGKTLRNEAQECKETLSKKVNEYKKVVENGVNQSPDFDEVQGSTGREKVFQCMDCHLKFTTRGSLNSHKRTNCKNMSKTCEYCTEAFPTMGKLIKHRNDCEKVLKMYYGKEFKSMKSYLVEMREESSRTAKKEIDDQYPVSEDGTATSSEDSTLQSAEKSYKCAYCTKEFTSSRSKSVHEHTHRPFGCPKCDERFSEERFLTVHTRFHCRKLPYECQYCTERFPTMGRLIKHRIRCDRGKVEDTDEVGANYQCDQCGKGFKYKKTMLAHTQKHVDDKKHQASEKDKNSASKHGMENSLNTGKNDSQINHDINSATSDAPEAFMGKDALDSQVVNHHYIQPNMFTTGYAAYQYGGKLESGVHQINEHPREVVYLYSPVMSYIPNEAVAQQEPPGKVKSFSCTLCGKGFTSAWGKTVHERSHSGAKPYECSRCHKHFTQKSSLTVHQRLHCSHNKGDLQCIYCRENFRTMGQMINHRSTCTATRDGVYAEELDSGNPTMVRMVEYGDNDNDTEREGKDKELISLNYDSAAEYYQIKNYDGGSHHKNDHTYEINSNDSNNHSSTKIDKDDSSISSSDNNLEINYCSSDNGNQNTTKDNFSTDHNNNSNSNSNNVVIVDKTFFPSVQFSEPVVVSKYEHARIEQRPGELRIYAPTAALPTAVPIAVTTITTTVTSQVTSRREKPLKPPSATKADTVPKAMPYTCPSCEETFLYKAALQAHEKKVHSNILRCFKCQTGFMRTEDFAEHVKMGCSFKRGCTSRKRENLEL